MDPNVSTQMPPDYSNIPLGEVESTTIKTYAFGVMAIVIASAIGFGVYLVFYRKTHNANKKIRHEQQAHDMEKGILPKSRHYDIGKVPKIRNKNFPRTYHSDKKWRDHIRFSNPPDSHLTSSSPKQTSSSFPLPSSKELESPRTSWASDATTSVPPPPKALTSRIPNGSFR